MDWFYHTKSRQPNADDLQALVEGKTPSHRYLQYIDGAKVNMTDVFLLKLSKQINAMANHGGGMLILGIKPLRKKAGKLVPVPHKNLNTDQVHQFILANNQPFLSDLDIIPIEFTEGQIVCIRIPAGAGPFMFSDNRYYSFRNEKVEKLDESGVRNLYNQANRKQLEIYSIYNTQGIPELQQGKYVSMLFYPRVLIRNAGQAAESQYKMEVSIPAPLYEENSMLTNQFSRHEGKYAVFSFPGKTPVFGNEIFKMLELKFRVKPETIDVFEQGELQIKLYYSEGMHEQRFPLKEIFMYRNQMLQAKDFKAIN
ncbi:MAG: ATP-binding protein [Bacteroidota bacterium]|nr:ATP-binding protein [Bacteroidota bacterium]